MLKTTTPKIHTGYPGYFIQQVSTIHTNVIDSLSVNYCAGKHIKSIPCILCLFFRLYQEIIFSCYYLSVHKKTKLIYTPSFQQEATGEREKW